MLPRKRDSEGVLVEEDTGNNKKNRIAAAGTADSTMDSNRSFSSSGNNNNSNTFEGGESFMALGDSNTDEDLHSRQLAVYGDNSGSKIGQDEEAVVPVESENVEASETLCGSGNEDASSCDNDACSLKHFDMIKDPSDHYFIDANGQGNNQKWHKKVQQDWSILQNSLPEDIYVRAYEDRTDLLRAVIIGPYGTPYQDGLFFFDFHLPPEYPYFPPLAYYHSGGWRINPNLYEEGKVCLSLLNTWIGIGNEVWDPTSSSILQVLVSLQGLVLNSKPYFNEAGYGKQVGTAEGEKKSLSYNENTFLLNCKTMMYLIGKPLKDFELLIKEHFKRRGHNILKACDAYMKGYLIGSLTKDASVSDNSCPNSTSMDFKLMLAKIVPNLFLSLSEVGADCEEFKHLREL